MQGETARRERESSDQGEEVSPEGLGGQSLLSQTDAGSPACQVVCQALHRKPGCVCGKASRGQMVESHTVLQIAYGVLYLCVPAVVCLQFEGVALAVGDEGVVAIIDEQRQLGAGRGSDPADYETHRCGGWLAAEGGVSGLCHIGGSFHPVGYGCPVGLGHGLYEVTQSPVLSDADGEAHTIVAAYVDDVVGVEAAVRTHGAARTVSAPVAPA